MKLKPISNNVLIVRDKTKDKTEGGLYLPDQAKEKPQRGEVLAVGPGKLLENGERAVMDVKPGNVVLFMKYSESEVTVDGQEYLIFSEDHILAVLN